MNYETYQNKLRMIEWERRMMMYRAGLYVPVKINGGMI